MKSGQNIPFAACGRFWKCPRDMLRCVCMWCQCVCFERSLKLEPEQGEKELNAVTCITCLTANSLMVQSTVVHRVLATLSLRGLLANISTTSRQLSRAVHLYSCVILKATCGDPTHLSSGACAYSWSRLWSMQLMLVFSLLSGRMLL